ncbi:hypothetical protein [Bacteroides acidifaciens]|uniref:hypothetical protein n=1 Tax=Bacteroides acidifaciens TaxID=85831 RepID=UPI001588A075|nr:hypothetical protein [Bacteroides acidifaciens]MCR2004149.1 hypothetical protein [Bacteroides acidifaciens]MDE6820492.1 hypothetical protein [Bacteroides acidifaciens]
MKTFIHYLVACIILGMVQACSQSTFEEELFDKKPITESGTVKFKYQGNIYVSKYERNGNDIIYQNKEVDNIINLFKENPNLSVYIHSDGLQEYFDSYSIFLNQEISNKDSINPTTRATGISSATLTVYTRTKYRGDKGSFTVNQQRPILQINDLGVYNLANKITSMKLNGLSVTDGPLTCKATFFEYTNCQGRSCTFQITYPNIDLGIKDFASISLNPIPLLPDPLDDKTNSIRLEL